MDDMELLQELRADAPEPGPERLAPLRERLAGATTTARRTRTLGRRAFLGGALGAGVAAALVIAAPIDEPPRPAPAPETLRPGSVALLEQAALVAERRSTKSPRPDQWVYTKERDVQPSDGRVSVREQWIRYDGKQTAGLGPGGEVRISDVPPDPGDDDLSPQGYREKLLKLPTDPDKLLAHVKKDRHWIDKPREEGVPHVVEPPDNRAYRVLSLYLKQQAVMPPKLEAAIYRALAKIPGVKIALGMRDTEGREGIGLYYEPQGQQIMTRYHLLDPDTYRLLEDRTVWHRDEYIGNEPAFKAGSVWTLTELANGVVDQAGQTP